MYVSFRHAILLKCIDYVAFCSKIELLFYNVYFYSGWIIFRKICALIKAVNMQYLLKYVGTSMQKICLLRFIISENFVQNTFEIREEI